MSLSVVSATISAGDSISSPADCGNCTRIARIVMPDAWSGGAPLTFQSFPLTWARPCANSSRSTGKCCSITGKSASTPTSCVVGCVQSETPEGPRPRTISRTTSASPRTRASTPSGSFHHGEVAASTLFIAPCEFEPRQPAHQRCELSERRPPQSSHTRPSRYELMRISAASARTA